MQGNISLAEKLGAYLLVESYLLGGNYAILNDSVPNYLATTQELESRPDLFKLYTIEQGTLIVATPNWVTEVYKELSDIDYQQACKDRKATASSRLTNHIHRFIVGKMESSLVNVDEQYIQLKIGINCVKQINSVMYEAVKIPTISYTFLETLNTLMILQDRVKLEMYIKSNDKGYENYISIQDISKMSKEQQKEVIPRIARGLENLNSGLCTVMTLRVNLKDVGLHYSNNHIIR